MEGAARKRFSYRLDEKRPEKTSEKILRLERENYELRSILNSTLHEVRLFSAIISDRSENLSQDTHVSARGKELSENILHASGMLSARLAYTDIEINPAVVTKQVRYDAVVYKKFDKSRYLLRPLISDKKLSVDFHGESHMSTRALSVFDMLPFVILQNAVKYSPPGYNVDVYFEEHGYDSLDVRISSYGPPVSDEEMDFLFDREFRGKNSVGYEGQGLGLNLAKRVCELHQASMKMERGQFLPVSIGGRAFQKFDVLVYFEKI